MAEGLQKKMQQEVEKFKAVQKGILSTGLYEKMQGLTIICRIPDCHQLPSAARQPVDGKQRSKGRVESIGI